MDVSMDKFLFRCLFFSVLVIFIFSNITSVSATDTKIDTSIEIILDNLQKSLEGKDLLNLKQFDNISDLNLLKEVYFKRDFNDIIIIIELDLNTSKITKNKNFSSYKEYSEYLRNSEPIQNIINELRTKYNAKYVYYLAYLNGIIVKIPLTDFTKIYEIAKEPYVRKIHNGMLPLEVKDYNGPLNYGVTGVGVNSRLLNNVGITGEGVRVGVIDTGVNHTDLIHKIAAFQNISDGIDDNDDPIEDRDMHGTHVAGIVHQIAPNANLYVASIETSVPLTQIFNTAEFALALEWLLRNDVDIISISLGTIWLCGTGKNGKDIVSLLADKAVEGYYGSQGLFGWSWTRTSARPIVIVSAGNEADRHDGNSITNGFVLHDLYVLDTSPHPMYIVLYTNESVRLSLTVRAPNGTVFNGVSASNYGIPVDSFWQTAIAVRVDRPFLYSNDTDGNIEVWTINVSGDRVAYYNLEVLALGYSFATFDTQVLNEFGLQLDPDTPMNENRPNDKRFSTTAPAEAKKVIAVGAVDRSGDIAWFSSRGPTTDGRVKPDVVAPGVNIWSTVPIDRDIYDGNRDGYTQMNGTSMAAPHVSGVAALLIQQYRELYGGDPTPAEIKALIMNSGLDQNENVKTTKDNTYGCGKVDAYRAYLSFVFNDTNGGIFGAETDEVRIKTPSIVRYSPVKGTLYWEDWDDTFDFRLDGTGASVYDTTAIVSRTAQPNRNYIFQIHGTNFGGLFDISERWYLATTYPPKTQTVGDQTIYGFNETKIELKEGESIIFYIPIGKCSITAHGAIRILAYLESGESINISLYDPNNRLISRSNLSDVDVIQVFSDSNPQNGRWKLIIKTNTGKQNVSLMSNYPLLSPIEYGLCWLRSRQNPDGSWQHNVGITSLAVLAFLNAGYNESDETVANAIKYITNHVHSDGSIYGDYYRRNYETSLAILALVATHNESYNQTIENAKNWLLASQWDEDCLWGSVNKDHWYYGGFGYGRNIRPDLSNTQFALMALDAAGVPKDDPVWAKAQVFLARCQNRQADVYIPELNYTVHWNPSYNKYNDGGFVYYPGRSLAEDVKSYGSMTGAGLWCLKLCGVPNDDPRVQAALDWVRNHYTWEGNPGMPDPTSMQYYYYLTMSKALVMTVGIDGEINGHKWYDELVNKLVELQKPEGYWQNPNSRAWENIPELVTAYAILSMEYRYIPTEVERLSWITFILHSNADLHVYDPLGRHVGINYQTGEMENKIPNATVVYTETEQMITVPQLKSGDYRVVLVGTGDGEYELTIRAGVGNETMKEESYRRTISKGETHEAKVSVAMIAGLTIAIEEPETPTNYVIQTATGRGNATFIPDKGEIEGLRAINESDLPEEGKPALQFPFGFFSFNITGLNPNQTVNITIALPQNIPTTAQYWKYGPNGSIDNPQPERWYQIPMGSNDGDNIITITLQDGGIGDDDGVANGVIVDQGGPGIPTAVARVPTLTPIGIIALAGLLLIIGISRIKKRK